MSTHTPGPWPAPEYDNSELLAALKCAEYWLTCPPNERKGATFYAGILMIRAAIAKAEGKLGVADARLIAAAPDMADLVRNIAGLSVFHLHATDPVLRQAVNEWRNEAIAILDRIEGRAAIAKAEGRQ